LDTATALGSPYSVWWDGYEYKFGALNEGVKADYTAWLKSYAIRCLYDLKPQLVDDAGKPDALKWKTAHDRVWDMLTAMQYEWGGSVSASSLQGVPGLVKVAELLMKEAGVTPLPPLWEIEAFVQAKSEEFSAMLELLMEDSAPKSRAAVLAKHKVKTPPPAAV
jgi:hypothetical protein